MAAIAEQVAALPPISTAIAGVMVALWFINFVFPSVEDVLALVAGRTIPCIWNVLTCGFLNDNLISVSYSYGQSSHIFAWFKSRLLPPFPRKHQPFPSSYMQLVVFTVAHLVLSRTVEPAQGPTGYIKFILVSISATGALTLCLSPFCIT